jgi:hypothetical protein
VNSRAKFFCQLFKTLLLLSILYTAGRECCGKEARRQTGFSSVEFSIPSGYFETAFSLTLKSSVEGGDVRYTTDGSEPTLLRGASYHDPLAISNTVVLRATVFKDGAQVGTTATRSYLFLDEVIHQKPNPPGFPARVQGQRLSYELSPRVVNDPVYRSRIRDSLKALPVVSLVFRQEDLFGSRAGIYLHSLQRGESWERPCSAEFIPADGSPGFQIDCGIRIQGNYNRIPEKSPKHSFRLFFKEKYGASKLRYPLFPDSTVKKFDTLVLRADYNNSWLHWDPSGQVRGQRIRDAWMKDSHRAMGWVAAHNRYVHLYLNGLYWGIYDAAERPDASFAAAYLGGDKEDYDVLNENQVKGGTVDRFNDFQSLHGVSQYTPYKRLKQQLDIVEYIDYLLLNYYAGNHDWGENKNWYAIGRRKPPAPFQYFVWDGEFVLQRLNDDVVNEPRETPFYLAENLRDNAEFRLAFADRVQKHFFGNGALTPAASAARWMKRADELDTAIIAESARWGEYRRNPPYTRDIDWLAEQRRLLESYFPRRTAVVLSQLRAARLYPNISAPIIAWKNNEILISSPDGGEIYYTTSDVDPRVPDANTISPHAHVFEKSFQVPDETRIKARILKAGKWSAMVESIEAVH